MSRRELKDKIVRVLTDYCKTLDEIQLDIGKKYTKKEISACMDILVNEETVIRYKMRFYSINKKT